MSRPDALSWQTLEALSNALASVRVANGWRTDLGKGITLEDDYAVVAGRKDPWLFIGMGNMPIDDQLQSRNQLRRNPEIVFEFALPVGYRDAWHMAHNGLADLIEAVPSSSMVLPQDVGKLTLTGTQILRRPEGFPVIVAQVTARVNLVERKPSAQ